MFKAICILLSLVFIMAGLWLIHDSFTILYSIKNPFSTGIFQSIYRLLVGCLLFVVGCSILTIIIELQVAHKSM